MANTSNLSTDQERISVDLMSMLARQFQCASGARHVIAFAWFFRDDGGDHDHYHYYHLVDCDPY